ncbi:DeoR/GlpR transcriptional regulator [Phycicoccus endophyticus]|uniref:DeoR/GlpR transcriptional regulator n=1 Tax=Phycicoccus endophyticus TaxID=1690220 RepID=A0A7G9R132_9MICO|nr:DeoR/GlpR family DNA-binding transcription regulator [Phycicoccus endophyticus]NHI20564.1 DeoR/GlpR transcriptional regulator [Phycicoccus endophyticus]QNN49307.1 DeoR/GlpR transcriptional regulator [Phycicoccus endophyticus]GGL45060.1 transcriptional regulator [Phycicoccus endophyticus]
MSDEANGTRTPTSRWAVVLDLLATRGRLTVAETARELGVSEATVRRDFAELARRQLATRHHGGVVATAVSYELPYRYRSSQTDDELERIAARAGGLVRPGEVVVLNGGTTTTAAARAITAREDLAGAGGERLTLVTNALNIAAEAVLRPHVQCVSLGGVARPESYEVSGPLALQVLTGLWFDVAVVGVNALSAAEGATCRFEDEAAVVRSMVERSRRVVLVAGGDKLGARTFAAICPAERITTLVTSAPEGHEEVRALRARGVDVVCV